jgi:hypothetical protein
MKTLTAALSILTPAFLFSIFSGVTITYESTIAFALISLLSVSLLAGVIALSKENN